MKATPHQNASSASTKNLFFDLQKTLTPFFNQFMRGGGLASITVTYLLTMKRYCTAHWTVAF